VATLVTITELLIEAYVPSLYDALGIYIPLIVVNCIILGRAEAYANKNSVGLAAFDGIGMGIGFTIALTVVGFFRELIGAGSAFGYKLLPDSVEPIGIFVKAPGAFLVLAIVIMVLNAFGVKNRSNELVNGCDGCCAACAKGKGCRKEEAK
jgi:electron transport complex protein RnfE